MPAVTPALLFPLARILQNATLAPWRHTSATCVAAGRYKPLRFPIRSWTRCAVLGAEQLPMAVCFDVQGRCEKATRRRSE